jgi:hypothetical protein
LRSGDSDRMTTRRRSLCHPGVDRDGGLGDFGVPDVRPRWCLRLRLRSVHSHQWDQVVHPEVPRAAHSADVDVGLAWHWDRHWALDLDLEDGEVDHPEKPGLRVDAGGHRSHRRPGRGRSQPRSQGASLKGRIDRLGQCWWPWRRVECAHRWDTSRPDRYSLGLPCYRDRFARRRRRIAA